MATVKINCPKCAGTGLTGTAQEGVCALCKGVGTYSVSDTDTVATVNTATQAATGTPMIVTAPTAVPAASLKVSGRGK